MEPKYWNSSEAIEKREQERQTELIRRLQSGLPLSKTDKREARAALKNLSQSNRPTGE